MALLITLTHARLRASQGDLRVARRIVHALLEEDPGNAEARELLASWRGRPGAEPKAVPVTAPVPPTAADPVELAERFREVLAPPPSANRRKIERLERWRERVVGPSDA